MIKVTIYHHCHLVLSSYTVCPIVCGHLVTKFICAYKNAMGINTGFPNLLKEATFGLIFC